MTTVMLQNRDQFWSRLGALSLLAGTILITALSFVHPHQADPNNNLAVFTEYAADTNWLATHVAQFFSNFLVLGIAAFVLYRSLLDKNERGGNFARLGMITAALCMAVFAVDQGLDGVALKRAVDAWASAPPETREIYFAAAQSIRWLEYGLNGMYNILLGMFTFFFSSAMIPGTVYPRWLGRTGTAAGLARVIVGVATLSTGFSPLVGLFNWIAFLGGTVWVFALAFLLWQNNTSQ